MIFPIIILGFSSSKTASRIRLNEGLVSTPIPWGMHPSRADIPDDDRDWIRYLIITYGVDKLLGVIQEENQPARPRTFSVFHFPSSVAFGIYCVTPVQS